MIIYLDRTTVPTLTLSGDKDVELFWDTELKGFALKLRRGADGRMQRSYLVQYRIGKQQRKIKLGDCAKITVDQARKKAEKLFAQITLGQDPQSERRVAAAPKITLRSALEQYVALKEREVEEGTYRASSLRITKLYLLGEAYFGPLHKTALNEITRAHVAQRLAAIRQESSDTTAGRARAQLAAFFTRMMQEGIAEANPCIGTKPQAERPQRERVLSAGELRAIWTACGDDDFGRIVKLLMLTGCRRAEIGGLKWSEIVDGEIRLPGARTKNHRQHVLPLSDRACEIIEKIPHRADRDFLFGERSRDGFDSWTQCKDALKDGIADPWVVHDIRRTVATGLANLGVQPHVIEALLNHVGHRAGVGGIYNKSSYAQEVRTALIRWADHIANIVDGTEQKVVPLRAS
jgi:integrase